MSTRLGTRPTISAPVTRRPRAAAARETSSKATCRGVASMSVMFMDTCAMPYSSMYQPMALVPLSVPGIQPSPEGFLRPFSRTSKATALARRVEVVFRLKFTATRKFRAPTLVAPALATVSFQAPPKSGLRAGSAIFSGSASYSPSRHTARFRRSGVNAAAS